MKRRRKQKRLSLAALLCFAVFTAFAVSFTMVSTAEAGTQEINSFSTRRLQPQRKYRDREKGFHPGTFRNEILF